MAYATAADYSNERVGKALIAVGVINCAKPTLAMIATASQPDAARVVLSADSHKRFLIHQIIWCTAVIPADCAYC